MTTSYFNLAGGNFAQDWSNPGLITANDDWSGVESITGYLGDIDSPAAADPRTVTGANPGAVDVIANQTSPAISNGGVAEFAITNPTVALNGSATADAPSLVFYMNAIGRQNVTFSANIRDLDATVDNSIQQVVVQYRIDPAAAWTNLGSTYIADATTGPSVATLVTPITVTLPSEVDNASQLQIRVLTTNATGNDEWVGVDDISITSTELVGGDQNAPTLAANNPTDPDNGDVAATASSNIVVRFNEPVVKLTGQITISDGGTDDRSFDVNDPQVSLVGSVLTINPSADLIAGRTYSVTIPAGSLEDSAGNDFAGTSFSFTVFDETAVQRIYTIQGASHSSALVGRTVITEGVVTAIDSDGYYIQDRAGDGDDRTSDGILVFTGGAPSGIAIGQELRVTGRVTEFAFSAAQLSVTQLTNSTFSVLSSGNVIAATVLGGEGPGVRIAPTEVFEDDDFTEYQPQTDGADFYESLEGMLVTVRNPLVVGPTSRFGETFVVADDGAGATGVGARGGIALAAGDVNPEKLQIDDDPTGVGSASGYNPAHTQGDLLGNVTGVMSYGFNFYELIVRDAVTIRQDVTLPKEVADFEGAGDRLSIASYNVENLDPGDNRFAALATDIVARLRTPDIIGLQEIQDADGAGTGSNFSGTATLTALVNAIVAAGGPQYSFVEIAPTANGTTGGEPNGNIRNAYLYDASRVTISTDAGSVRLVDPTNAAFNNSRKPLAVDFLFNGEKVTVIDMHSTSRGGSDAAQGSNQPPANAGDASRNAQAAATRAFVDGLRSNNPAANVVVLGDLNGYYFEQSVNNFQANDGLLNLFFTLPPEERYSYQFRDNVLADYNLQPFDNILVTEGLATDVLYDQVHINAEQLEGDRATDHDPAVAALFIPVAGVRDLMGTDGTDRLLGGASADTLQGAGGNDALFGGSGGDQLFGEDGNDTIDGGLGDDTIYGQAGNDVIEGGSGNDAIGGQEGDDLIFGEGGADTLYGNEGADTLFGQDGNDVVFGGAGNDAIGGQAGDDVMSGDEGDDIVYGNEGNDTLFGQAGNDTVFGGAGNDAIGGQDGNDQLFGDAGADSLYGLGGADVLTGGDGADVFYYLSALDSPTGDGTFDRIADFQVFTDKLDLTGLRTGGADTFGTVAIDEGLYVFVDQGGDGIADFVVLLSGIGGVASGDILF